MSQSKFNKQFTLLFAFLPRPFLNGGKGGGKMESRTTNNVANTNLSSTTSTVVGTPASVTPAYGGNESSSAGEIFTVERNTVISCNIELSSGLPIDNIKCTQTEKVAFIGLHLVKGRHNGKLYLAAKKQYLKGWAWALPKGSIVFIYHQTGSWKNVYHKYKQYFMVVEGEYKGILVDEKDEKGNIEYKTVNLKPIEMLDEKKLAEIEAEIMNNGWFPSQFDPVRILYYYWKKQITIIPATSDIDKKIEELQKLIEQKRKELEELERQLNELIKQKEIPGRIASVVK